MYKKVLLISFNLLLLLMLVSGCSSSSAPAYNSLNVDLPPEVEAKLETIPEEPIVGEPAVIRVKLLDKTTPRDGMRIELRNNARETRLYEAEEKVMNEQLVYEIKAVFEQSGENMITYHFNAEKYHVMSSFTIEVKEADGR